MKNWILGFAFDELQIKNPYYCTFGEAMHRRKPIFHRLSSCMYIPDVYHYYWTMKFPNLATFGSWMGCFQNSNPKSRVFNKKFRFWGRVLLGFLSKVKVLHEKFLVSGGRRVQTQTEESPKRVQSRKVLQQRYV